MKILYGFSFIALFFMLMVIGYYFYWTLWPFNPVTINGAATVNPKIVHQGGAISYTIDFCRHTDAPAVSTRVYVDGIEFFTPAIISQFPKGCYVKTFTMQVPESLPPGTYSLEVRNAYQLNKLREVISVFKTNSFEVTK